MEANNTPAAIGSEALSVLKTASEVLQRNQISVSTANEKGQQIVALINTQGMSDELDEKCNAYMVQVNKTSKAMNERRSPITQLMTQVAKQFTTLENELKEGKTVLFIQQSRNDWAKKKADAARKAEAEAKRKLAVENEKVEVKKKIELDLISFVNARINQVSEHLMSIFNNATLENIDAEIAKIKTFSSDYNPAHYDSFKTNPLCIYLNAEELEIIVSEVKESKLEGFKKSYYETIDDLKINLEAKVQARKNELEKIAILEKENAEAAEKAKADAAERQRLEAEQAKADAAEKAKSQENQVQSNADAAKLNNLFAATEAVVIPNASKAQVRTAVKMIITHQSAWVEVFTRYMQIEGMKLGIDELGKKSLNQMKAACEKNTVKTGDLIESKYIKYEDDFTAINKA